MNEHFLESPVWCKIQYQHIFGNFDIICYNWGGWNWHQDIRNGISWYWYWVLWGNLFAVILLKLRNRRWYQICWNIRILVFWLKEYNWNSQLGVGVVAVAGADTTELLIRSYVSQSHTELLTIEKIHDSWNWNSICQNEKSFLSVTLVSVVMVLLLWFYTEIEISSHNSIYPDANKLSKISKVEENKKKKVRWKKMKKCELVQDQPGSKKS